MPPKKKKGSPVIDGVDTSTMSREQLEKFAQNLTNEMEREREERNFFQLERDKLRTFWEITRNQLEEAKAQLRAKDRQVELAQEHADVEIKHNTQQMKHLQYENLTRIGEMKAETMTQLKMAQEEHGKQELELLGDKRDLRRLYREAEEMSEMQMQQLKMKHSEQMSEERNRFTRQLREFQRLHDQKLQQCVKELETRHRMDTFEVEERRSAHISRLTVAHEDALEQIRAYYNEVTMNQLSLIGSLKEQMEELRERLEKSEKTAASVTFENKRLLQPMKSAQAELVELRKKLENYDRDRATLRRTQTRSESARKQLDDWRWETEALRMRCDQLVQERDAMRTRFEEVVVELQQKNGVKAVVLERKLTLMQKEVEKREAVLGDVLTVAGMDPTLLSQKMELLLRVKNEKIHGLRSELARLTSMLDDSVATYESVLIEFGVPEDVVNKCRPAARRMAIKQQS